MVCSVLLIYHNDREPAVRFGSVRFLSVLVPTDSGSKKQKSKNQFFDVFQFQNGFWTLLDGPLDTLDRYKNPKQILVWTFF